MKKKQLIVVIVVALLAAPLVYSFVSKSLLYSNQNIRLNKKNNTQFGAGTTSMMAEPMPMVDEEVATEMMVEPMPPTVDDGRITDQTDRTIVKTADLSLISEDTEKTVEDITQATQNYDGLVTSSHVYENDYQKGIVNAEMTVRIPVDALDQAVKEFKSFAVKVTNENITAQDKTEQKIDLEAQIANLQSTEQQFVTIMQKATTVEETLQVQRELSNVRGQIERYQARLENLEGSAAMSTIHIFITTKESELPVIEPDQNTIIEEIKVSVREAVALYRNLFVLAIKLAILGLPIWLIVGGVILYKKRNK